MVGTMRPDQLGTTSLHHTETLEQARGLFPQAWAAPGPTRKSPEARTGPQLLIWRYEPWLLWAQAPPPAAWDWVLSPALPGYWQSPELPPGSWPHFLQLGPCPAHGLITSGLRAGGSPQARSLNTGASAAPSARPWLAPGSSCSQAHLPVGNNRLPTALLELLLSKPPPKLITSSRRPPRAPPKHYIITSDTAFL